MSPVSLGDASVTSSSAGVVVAGIVSPENLGSFNLAVVNGSNSHQRITDPIDNSYIVGGNTAYVTYFDLGFITGRIQFYLNSTNTTGNTDSSVQFTEAAEDNIYIVIFYGNTSAAWNFNLLENSDETNPYVFTADSVNAAGPAITRTLTDAVDADSTVKFLLVDSSHSQIDIDNLQWLEPSLNLSGGNITSGTTSITSSGSVQLLSQILSITGGNISASSSNITSSGSVSLVDADPLILSGGTSTSGVSLSDSRVTSSSPGVLVKGTVLSWQNSNIAMTLVFGGLPDHRISTAIDSSYIQGGGTAYWTVLGLRNDGQMFFRLDSSDSSTSGDPGLQFTEVAEDNIYIVLFYGDTSAVWDFSELDNSDETNPYAFTATSVGNAGPAITSQLRSDIDADDTVIAMLVDSSHSRIDIDSLQLLDSAPTPTSIDVNFGTTTITSSGSVELVEPIPPPTVYISKGLQDVGNNGASVFSAVGTGSNISYQWTITGGTSGNRGSLDNANTANVTWRTSSESSRNTFTLTVTVTDDQSRTATDSIPVASESTSVSHSISTSSQEVNPGASISLDSSSSGNGLIAMWTASVVSGDSGSGTGTFASSTSTDTSWTSPSPTDRTVYRLTNTVRETTGPVLDQESSRAFVVMVVNPPEEDAPTVDITTNAQTVDSGATVTLEADTTGTGSLTHAWTVIPSGGTFGNSALEDTTWEAPIVAEETTYSLTLTTTDQNSRSGSDSVNITVRAAAAAPVINITSPVDNTRIYSNIAITLSTTIVGGQGDVTIQWSGPAFSRFTGAPADRSRTYVYLGSRPDTDQTITLTATATDSLGRTSQDTLTLIVSSTDPVSIPSAPSTPTLTVVDHDSLRATWTAVIGATSYQGQYKKAADAGWTTIFGNITSGYQIDSLDASTAYNFRVRATNSAGSSSYSSAASATTNAAPAMAVSLFEDSQTISGGLIWKATTDPQNNVVGGSTFSADVVIGSTAAARASNAILGNAVTGDDSVYVILLRLFSTGSRAIDLFLHTDASETTNIDNSKNFTSTIGPNLGLAIRENSSGDVYKFNIGSQWVRDSTNPYQWPSTQGHSDGLDWISSTNRDKLISSTSVTSVIVDRTASDIDWDNLTRQAQTSSSAPSVPSTPTLSVVDNDSLRATWAAVSGATSYQGQYKKASDTNWTQIPGNISSGYQIDGLDANTAYNFRVRATNSAGSSNYSSIATATTSASSITTPGANSLFHSSQTISGGLLWKSTTDPQDYRLAGSTFGADVVNGSTAASRASEAILSSSITGSEAAYVVLLRLFSTGNRAIDLSLNRSASSITSIGGGEFNSTVGPNLGVALRDNETGNVYRFDVGSVWNRDSTNPYQWPSDAAVGGGLDRISTTNRNALISSSNVTSIIVDKTASDIDWNGLLRQSVTPVPAVPNTPTLAVVDHNTLRASWTTVTGATTYQGQYKKTSDGTWIDISGDITSGYLLDNLDSSASYDFRVRATNSSGSSNYSAKATASTRAAPGVPTVVQSLSPAPSDTQVVLTWAAPSSNGGSAITRYEYRYKISSAADSTYSNWVSVSTALTATITGLTNGTQYTFEVRAVTANGDGASASTMSTPVAPTSPPATPSPPTLTAVDHDKIRVEWGAVTNASGYDLQWRQGTSGDYTLVQDVSSPYTISSLTSATSYQVRIRAKNSAGTSGWTAIRSRTTGTLTVPGIPVSLRIVAIDSDTLRAFWSRSSSGGFPTYYDLRYRTSPSGSFTTVENVNSPYDINRLTIGTSYDVQVRARNAAGSSSYSSIVTGTTSSATTESRILPLYLLVVDNSSDDTLPTEFSLYQSDRSIFVEDWVMAEANIQSQTLIPYSPATGPSVHERTRNLVEEQMSLYFEGSNLRENIRTVERIVESANNDTHNVYLAYDNNVSGVRNLWRSPLIVGSMSMVETSQISLVENKCIMNLKIVREPWWEEHDTVRTAFTTRNDISNGDPLSINGSNILGTIPSPLEITITKSTSGYNNKGTHIQVFQDNQVRDRGSSTDSYTVSKSSSGFGSAESNFLWFTGNITPLKNLGRTQWYNFLIEHSVSGGNTPLDNILMRASVGIGTEGTNIRAAENNRTFIGEYYLSGRIQDGRESYWTNLGPVPIYRETKFFIDVTDVNSWNATSSKLHFCPIDNYRRIEMTCRVNVNDMIRDTGNDVFVSLSEDSSSFPSGEDRWIPGGRGIGLPLTVIPGKDSKLLFFFEDENHNAIPDNWTISGRYRARRLTI